MDVGVRELKQRLSEYLERAERGEVIRVTDRGRPKAMLGPLPGRLSLEEGIAEGWVTPGTGGPLRSVKRRQGLRSTAEVVAEDRGQ
jgi:prevent-host-death family protein